MSESKEIAVAEQPQQVALTVQERAVIALGGSEREEELKVLAAKYVDITEIKNKAGRQQCHAAAMELTKVMTSTNKAGEDAREDAVAIQKAVIVVAKRQIGILKPERDRLIALRDSWDAAEEAEKSAKAAAEKTRVDAIRAKIDAIRATPAKWIGKPSAEIGVAADHLSETVIALEDYEGCASEAIVERDHAVKQMREMQAKQAAHEAEQTRLAAERAELERLRAETAERDRIAAEEREAQAKKDREAAEAAAAERDREIRRIEADRKRIDGIRERIAAIKATVAMQAGKSSTSIESAISALQAMDMSGFDEFFSEAEEARHGATVSLGEMRASVLAMEQAQAELSRQQAELAAAKVEQERIEREAREAAEAQARAEAARIADEEQRKREEADEAARVEAERIERERQAEAERAALAAEVARLQALHFADDGLGMLENVLEEIARPVGRECCGQPTVGAEYMGQQEMVCCGCPEPFYHDVDSLSVELNKWRDEIIARRAEHREAA